MNKTIIAILTLSLLLMACTQQGPTGKTTPFLGGSTCLKATFEENAPPLEVFDGGDEGNAFDVEIGLENIGETAV